MTAGWSEGSGNVLDEGAAPMPKCLALFSYSKEAIAAMIESPADREAAVRHVAESVGGRLRVARSNFAQPGQSS
jgi:hypothetical protein